MYKVQEFVVGRKHGKMPDAQNCLSVPHLWKFQQWISYVCLGKLDSLFTFIPTNQVKSNSVKK
jgi:hypothetical protein